MLTIRFLPDLHYFDERQLSQSENEAFQKYVDNILTQLFTKEADIYLSLGDLINYCNPNEAEQIYDKISSYKKPFIHLFGNHDVFKMPRSAWPEDFNVSNECIEYPEGLVVLLDTARALDEDDYSGYLTTETLNWLENILKESKDKPVLIFAHHGVWNTTRGTHRDMLHIQNTNIEEILEMKEAPAFFFHGHNHHDSIVQRDNWTFVQGCSEIDSPTIRQLEIDAEKLVYTTENLMTPQMQEWHNVFYGEREVFTPVPTGPGTILERNATFRLYA